ncbi:MAG: hypothetical protein ACJAYE_003531 [Candidatus Azotimanducaceae bacterium]|jgi:hypothetical protein
MGVEVGGLGGPILLIADIWAISRAFQSNASTGEKVIWVIVILLLVALGLILWLLFSPSKPAG